MRSLGVGFLALVLCGGCRTTLKMPVVYSAEQYFARRQAVKEEEAVRDRILEEDYVEPVLGGFETRDLSPADGEAGRPRSEVMGRLMAAAGTNKLRMYLFADV